MKSIQTKFILLILAGILLTATVTGGAGVYWSRSAVDKNSARIMNLMCTQKAQELDGLLERVEQAVSILAVHAKDTLDSPEKLVRDEAYRGDYTAQLEKLALNIGNSTEGAIALYVRYNPELMPPDEGFFFRRSETGGKFTRAEITDLSQFSPADIGHVGWYYEPVNRGKAVWLEPYQNENIDVYMISYCIPLYQKGILLGVVGMDIDFDLITKSIAELSLYDSGSAFLANSKRNVVYFHDALRGTLAYAEEDKLRPFAEEVEKETGNQTLLEYGKGNERRKLAFSTLNNGMQLFLTAPVEEIDAGKNALICQIVAATIGVSLFFVVLTVLFARKLIKPLKELNAAANRIAGGDLSVPLSCHTRDEVGMLAESFRQTVSHLKEYIDFINDMAYHDSLTGLRNKAAYKADTERLTEWIRKGCAHFAVAVFDINGLKQANDQHGHEYGDLLIIRAAKLFTDTFEHSLVYRIGGDEFAVILENEDYEKQEELFCGLKQKIETAGMEYDASGIEVSVAGGIAIYDSASDRGYADVFHRADQAMYQNKLEMKGRV